MRTPATLPSTLRLRGVAHAAMAAALALQLQCAAAQTARFDIPAQPLAPALAALAAQAGLQLAFPPALAEGRSAPAVQGTQDVADALRALLAGSGLQGRVQGRTLVVERAPAPGARTALPAVTVTAQGVRDGTTEGTGSYQATATSTATKLNLTPRETPQTVTVISQQQMDDAGMTSVDDALKVASGVYLYDRGGNGSLYYSRGFEMQAQYDGMAAPGGIGSWNRAPQVDRAFLDRVEVLQGAAGLLSGGGEPGGTVNLIRKRPTDSFQGQAEVQLGSWNQRRMVADLSGPLAASGAVRGRLVAVADDADSFVDYVYRDRRAIYGIVEADLTPDTLVSASVQYQRDKGRTHFGPPFAADGSDAGLRRSMFFGDANYRQTKDITRYTLGLTQRLAGAWNLKATYSRIETGNSIRNYSYLNGSLNPVTGDGLTLERMREFDRDTRAHALDVYVSGLFDLLGRTHELVVGVNGSTYRDAFQSSGYPAGTPINVHAFDPTALGPVPAGGNPSTRTSQVKQHGLFGVARWNLSDSLKLITGARISEYEDKNLLAGTTNLKKRSVFSPYAGLVYDLNTQYSVYASYSDIFTPQSSKSADGSTLKPVVGANYELGIKGELLDKRLNVSAAVFRLEQTNLAREDDSVPFDPGNVCGGTCYIAADKVVSQGVDLGVNGQVGRGLNLAAGYTYASSEYAAGAQKGERYRTDAPRHSLRLAANYQLPGTAWSVGGNVAATSKTYKTGWSSPNTIRQNALVLIGLNAKYQINPQAEVLLAVSNLTDRSYRNLEGTNYSTFGEPRKFTANLKYRF